MNEPNIPAVEVTRASKLADMIESNEKLKKWLMRLIMIVLIVIFFGFLAWGINRVLMTEGTEIMPEDYKASLSATPKTGEDAVAFLRNLIAKSSDENRTKVSVNTSFEIEDKSVNVSDDSNILVEKAILFMKEETLENLSGYYKDSSTGFGEPLADLLFPVGFKSSELKSWKVEEDGENRTFAFEFPKMSYNAVRGDVREGLGMNEADGFKEYLKEKLSPVAEVKDSSITCIILSISGSENRLTDQINNVTYTRTYEIDASVMFKGELESLGMRNISFIFTSKTDFSFTWAGITLSDSVIWMEKGKTEIIEAYRTADELLDVTWISSDDSVATVDSEGYVKGIKTSPAPVTVTATVDYLGNIYTAECLVYVVVPVKKAELITRELILKPGENAELVADISPEKATIKDVRWFSTDETVASVDDNGKITAVSSGFCKVYCITINGNFKSSCTVTISE